MGNLTGKSADSGSVEGVSPRPRRCLDLPATLLHDASTGREQTILNAVSLVARRRAHARFACAKQNRFFLTGNLALIRGSSVVGYSNKIHNCPIKNNLRRLFSKKSPCGGGRAASPLVLRTRRLQSIFRRPRSAAFRSLRFAHALRVVVVEFYYTPCGGAIGSNQPFG